MDPDTVVTMTEDDLDLIKQALAEFERYHLDLADKMLELHEAGGNGIITANGASMLAGQHSMLSERAEILAERLHEPYQRLAYIQEV